MSQTPDVVSLADDPWRAFALGCATGGLWGFSGTMMAMLEVEVEGRYAWARALPTWRLGKKGEKLPVTGYHVALFFAVFSIMVNSYIGTTLLTLNTLRGGDAFRLISMLLLFFTVEDSAFFRLNPVEVANHFGSDLVWLLRFGVGHVVVSVALLTAATLMDCIAFSSSMGAEDWPRAALGGLTQAAGVTFVIIMWLPFNRFVFAPIHSSFRAFFFSRMETWRRSNSFNGVATVRISNERIPYRHLPPEYVMFDTEEQEQSHAASMRSNYAQEATAAAVLARIPLLKFNDHASTSSHT